MENKQAETKRPRICLFCNQEDDNELLYGKIYELDDIVTHYYCLLLSSNMEQNGGDNDGILGFLREDILKELKRGKRLVCWYCKRSGATLGCCVARCKKVFHLPCGRKDGSLHQFFGQFKSFCSMHRPVQKIDASVLKEVSNKENSCTICYERVEASACSSTLWAPCCRINAWFHRDCVQRLAMSAGYFFKCPLCNNKTTFQKAMLDFGIYIPEQDASWELVPNAFQELLHRHNRCDAFKCNCPKGRGHDMGGTRWELVLCKYCGSQGIHLGCGPLRWSNPEWECDDCKDMLQNSQERGDDEEEEEEQEQVSEPVPAPSSVLQPRRRRRHRPGNYHFGPVRKSKPPAVRQTESPAPSSPEASKEGQVPSPMAAGPVSPPTPIAVVEVSDDDIIEILDDDDSNDQNVILSSDGIAIPVVQVMSIPIDNDGRDFCVEGDVNVRVPGQLNPSPSPPVPRTTPLSKAVPPPVPKLEPPVPKAASPVQRPAAPVERTAPPVLRAAPPVLRAAPPVLRAAPPVLRAAPTVQRPTLPVQRPAPQVSTRASLPAPRPTPSFPAQQDTSGPTYMSQGYPTFQNGNSAKKLKMSDSTPAMGLQPTLPYNGQAASSVVMGGSNLLKSYLSTNNPPQQQQQPQPPPPLQSFQFGMLPYTNQSLASPAAAVYPNNRGSATKQHGTSTSPRVPSSTGAAATTTTTTASTRPCNRPNRNGIVREQTHRSAAPTQRKSGHSDDRVMSSNVRLSDLQFRVVGTTKLQMVFLDQSVVTFDLRPNGLKSPCRKITNQSSYKSSGSNPARPALVSPPIVQSESVATQSQASPPAQSTDTAPVKKKKKVLNMYPSRKRKRSLSAKKSTDDNSPAAPVMRLRSVTSRASRSTSQPVPTSSKTVSEVADSAKRNRIGGSVGKLSVTPIAGKKTPRYNTRSRSEEDCLQLRRLHGRRRMFQTPVAPPVNVELPPLSKRKKPNKNVEPAPEASTSSVIPLDNDTTISEDDLISALNNDISSNMDLLDYIETRSFSDCEFVEDSCSEVTIFIDHDDRHSEFGSDRNSHSVCNTAPDLELESTTDSGLVSFDSRSDTASDAPSVTKRNKSEVSRHVFKRSFSPVITRSKSKPVLRSSKRSQPSFPYYEYPEVRSARSHSVSRSKTSVRKSRRDLFVESKASRNGKPTTPSRSRNRKSTPRKRMSRSESASRKSRTPRKRMSRSESASRKSRTPTKRMSRSESASIRSSSRNRKSVTPRKRLSRSESASNRSNSRNGKSRTPRKRMCRSESASNSSRNGKPTTPRKRLSRSASASNRSSRSGKPTTPRKRSASAGDRCSSRNEKSTTPRRKVARSASVGDRILTPKKSSRRSRSADSPESNVEDNVDRNSLNMDDYIAKLKATALSARKFRPTSRTEDLQRKMLKELQSLSSLDGKRAGL